MNTEEVKTELASKLNEIHGVNLGPDALGRFPSFDILLLTEPHALAKFCEAMEWFVERVRSS